MHKDLVAFHIMFWCIITILLILAVIIAPKANAEQARNNQKQEQTK